MLSNGNKQHRENHYTSCPELINSGNSDLSYIDWASFISEVSDLRLLRVIAVIPYCNPHAAGNNQGSLDARFRNPPIGGFKHVECLSGTPLILSLEKTWFFQLCMIASTLFWSNSMDSFNGPIVLRIHF